MLLLSCFNQFLSQGLFPKSWKESLILLIPKSSPGKFCPISLALCLLKVMERLIKTRLIQWFESNLLLPPSQFGFRKSRSCADNLSILTTEIYIDFVKNQYTACLFLDISNAFNDVNPGILSHDLRDMGVPWSICKFMHDLTSNRSIFFKVAGETHGLFQSHKEVPQGCILSFLLYILYTKRLEKKLHENSSCLQYTDDVALFFRANRLQDCILSLQSSLDNISTFLHSRDLSIPRSKFKMLIFTRKSYDHLADSVSVDSHTITISQEAKFLGFTFDSCLSWKPHINNLISSCKKNVNIFESLCSI